MKCPIETRDNAEVLLDYCARKLDPDRAATLERHIRICPACREFADSQRAVWNALDAWEALPVSPDFDRRLYARIEREVSWWDRLLRPFRPLLVRQGLPVAAGACLAIMAGILLDRSGDVPVGAEAQSVQVEAVPADQLENALDDMELLRDFNQKVRVDAGRTRM